MEELTSTYLCYMITHQYERTYVGITNDLPRRLRQHRGEIKGGAKATQRYDDWEVAFYIRGFRTHRESLSFEWNMHHPNGKRCQDASSKQFYGPLGRLRALAQVLERWMTQEKEIDHLQCILSPKCRELLEKDPDLHLLLSSFIEIRFEED